MPSSNVNTQAAKDQLAAAGANIKETVQHLGASIADGAKAVDQKYDISNNVKAGVNNMADSVKAGADKVADSVKAGADKVDQDYNISGQAKDINSKYDITGNVGAGLDTVGDKLAGVGQSLKNIGKTPSQIREDNLKNDVAQVGKTFEKAGEDVGDALSDAAKKVSDNVAAQTAE